MNICFHGKRASGFTLIEMAIVVAVGSLFLIGVGRAPQIIADYKANAEIADLSSLVVSIQKIYARKSNYAGATLAQVIGLNGFPPERVVNATSAANRWGGAITLDTISVNSTDDAMEMTTVAIPSFECTNIVPAIESRFSKITVGGLVVKDVAVPFNLNGVIAGCKSSANVTIIYRFGK